MKRSGLVIDTTINIARLALGGALDGFPHLRFVFSHLGGAFFAIKNRLNPAYFVRPAENLSNGG